MIEVNQITEVTAAVRELVGRWHRENGAMMELPRMLDQARKFELISDGVAPPGEAAPALWGGFCMAAGVRLSLELLSILARVSPNLALVLHYQGLAALMTVPQGTVAIPPARALARPGDHAPLRLHGDDKLLLSGELDAVISVQASVPVVVFIPDSVSACATVAVITAAAPGVTWRRQSLFGDGEDIGQWQLKIVNLPLGACEAVAAGPAGDELFHRIVACDWLGRAAIVRGILQGAIAGAGDYAQTRRQGGGTIGAHAAVRLLLANAGHALSVLDAFLEEWDDRPLRDFPSPQLWRWAIDAAVLAATHGNRAVSDCLQVLGGYGYMEDNGFAPQMMAAALVAALHGGPEELLLLRDPAIGARA